jgi:hypothetical protein
MLLAIWQAQKLPKPATFGSHLPDKGLSLATIGRPAKAFTA